MAKWMYAAAGSGVASKHRNGGIFNIEAANMDEAKAMARLHPATRVEAGEAFGWTIEIRPSIPRGGTARLANRPRLGRAPVARFAAGLGDQPDTLDRHGFVERLGHCLLYTSPSPRDS